MHYTIKLGLATNLFYLYLFLFMSLLLNISCSKDNSLGQEKQFRAEYSIDTEGWALNDGYKYTTFSAPHLNIEPKKGIGYVSGLAGGAGYTESGGNLILAVFPCVQPYQVEYYCVAKTGDLDIDGEQLSGVPYDMSSMSFYDSEHVFIIRSFFVDYNGHNLYYRDFNADTKQFVSAPVKVRYYDSHNNLADITDYAMTKWVEQRGGSWSGPQKNIFTNHIINDKSLWSDGDFLYSVLTAAGPGNPIVVKSDDYFSTLHLVTILPYNKADCETAIAKHDGIVYIVYRDSNKVCFQTTRDFITYTAIEEISGSAAQRPEILVYKDNVYLFVPIIDTGIGIMGGRTSYYLLKGKGSSIHNFDTELILRNKFGMVYASAKFLNGRLLVAYSTNLLMLGEDKTGKSTMMFYIVKDYYQ